MKVRSLLTLVAIVGVLVTRAQGGNVENKANLEAHKGAYRFQTDETCEAIQAVCRDIAQNSNEDDESCFRYSKQDRIWHSQVMSNIDCFIDCGSGCEGLSTLTKFHACIDTCSKCGEKDHSPSFWGGLLEGYLLRKQEGDDNPVILVCRGLEQKCDELAKQTGQGEDLCDDYKKDHERCIKLVENNPLCFLDCNSGCVDRPTVEEFHKCLHGCKLKCENKRRFKPQSRSRRNRRSTALEKIKSHHD
eukprot:TRINITY_DN1008_c0_g1_i1.p1 TRINITY_DN1008_c0_g1~~TRINITY_DN1008_c0_g1_i1.p1  ORF type:complete len:246 (+),score=0.48 TRINITY_DN1008_c0_g1_i1:119-856(+)